MLAPEAAGLPVDQAPAVKLQVVKAKTSDQGQVVYLRFIGVVDEDFSGHRLAQTISCRMLVIDLSGVKRISSYGIAEWSNFIRHVSKRVETVYLVACSPKVVDQLNLVADFAGSARVHSFLAPYRCEHCDAESVRLVQLDSDWEMIRSQNLPDFPCGTCGTVYTFDENPAVFLSYVTRQGPIAIPQEVQTYIAADVAARLDHGEPIGPTFWAEKFVKDKCSYLRLTGNLDGTFPDRKLIEGLEGTIVLDVAGITKVYMAGAALWRNFIEAIKPAAQAVFLTGVPVAFERLRNEDYLGTDGGTISISLPFSCAQCGTTWDSLVDVQENIDLIRMATPPERPCPDCKGATVCVAPEAVLARLTKLKKPDVPSQVRKFIDEANRKLKEARKAPAATVAEAAGRGRSPTGILIGAGALAVVAAAVAVVVILLRREVGATALKSEEAAKLLQSSSPERPDWIASDMPLSSACKPAGELVRCTGVSSYAETLDEARAQAEVSALDGFVQFTALQVNDPVWQRKVSGLYGAARTAKLENLERARQQPDRSRYESAIKDVVDSRDGVVKALRKTGGSLAPSQVSHEYWEEYQMPDSSTSRFLVFASVETPVAQTKRLAELYSTPVAVREAKSVTSFPGIAWRYPEIQSGAMLLELNSGGLRAIGLTDRYIVTSVQDRAVDTADSFASILAEELEKLKSGGSIKLVVKTGDTPPVEFSHPVQTIIRPASAEGRGGRGSSRPSSGAGSTPLNTWDRVGGDRKYRDDPRQ